MYIDFHFHRKYCRLFSVFYEIEIVSDIILVTAKLKFLSFSYVKVRKIKRGINPSSVKDIYFTGEYLGKGFKIGIVAGMIALTVSNFDTKVPLLMSIWPLTPVI